MKNIFIDSNIWLSIYAFSDDDIGQFNKLNELIMSKDVTIFLPDQTENEVKRNRETKIKAVLKDFKEWKFLVPNFCKGCSDYGPLKETIMTLKKQHKKLLAQVEKDISARQLTADRAIFDLFEKSICLESTEEIINMAKLRFDTGNPPGKNKSYGDAINWVALLKSNKVPNGEPLFFISADGDYRSPLDDKKFNLFLEDEWKDTKNSEIFFYMSLTDFFSKHMKDITLKNENEKNKRIDSLMKSSNFQETHNIIAQLKEVVSFSDEQVIKLCQIAVSNSQVGSIIGDYNVIDFYERILNTYNGSTNDCVEKVHSVINQVHHNI